jgi:positive regulator of sigma E activity
MNMEKRRKYAKKEQSKLFSSAFIYIFAAFGITVSIISLIYHLSQNDRIDLWSAISLFICALITKFISDRHTNVQTRSAKIIKLSSKEGRDPISGKIY